MRFQWLDPTDAINTSEDSDDAEPPRPMLMKNLDSSELLDRCGDELAVIVDEDWTHRIMNPRAT